MCKNAATREGGLSVQHAWMTFCKGARSWTSYTLATHAAASGTIERTRCKMNVQSE